MNVRDHAEAEAALRQSEASYRAFVQGAPCGIYRCHADGTLVDLNPALVRMLGYTSAEELRMKGPGCGWLPARFGHVTHDALTFSDIEVEWKRKNGLPRMVRLSGRAVPTGEAECCEVMVEDVTDRHVQEQQRRQALKLVAVGKLAGGIAHDFNNLLTVIRGYSSLLRESLDTADPRQQDVAAIEQAAERATSLTKRILAFSRRQALTPTVLDLSVVVADVAPRIRRLIGEEIELVLEHSETTPVLGVSGELEQIVMNLAVTARDAMTTSGTLTIAAGHVLVDGAGAGHAVTCPPGRYVRLAISATTRDMAPHAFSHLSQPAFMTNAGRGTRLGLATVYGIVEQSGGHMAVQSEPGRATTFTVYFPHVDADDVADLASVAPGPL